MLDGLADTRGKVDAWILETPWAVGRLPRRRANGWPASASCSARPPMPSSAANSTHIFLVLAKKFYGRERALINAVPDSSTPLGAQGLHNLNATAARQSTFKALLRASANAAASEAITATVIGLSQLADATRREVERFVV